METSFSLPDQQIEAAEQRADHQLGVVFQIEDTPDHSPRHGADIT